MNQERNESSQFIDGQEFKTKKIKFFDHLAKEYLPEMRLLFRGGKLSKEDGWRNVAEHCLTQVAIADVLGEMLNLSAEEKNQLAVVAGCHDWEKRLSKRPGDFSDSEIEQAQSFLAKAHPDQVLMAATGSSKEVQDRIESPASTLLERLQYYIDRIVNESDIIDPDTRIEIAKERYPNLSRDFLDREKELSQKIGQEIFGVLQSAGDTEITSASELPLLIKQKIFEKIIQENTFN